MTDPRITIIRPFVSIQGVAVPKKKKTFYQHIYKTDNNFIWTMHRRERKKNSECDLNLLEIVLGRTWDINIRNNVAESSSEIFVFN